MYEGHFLNNKFEGEGKYTLENIFIINLLIKIKII